MQHPENEVGEGIYNARMICAWQTHDECPGVISMTHTADGRDSHGICEHCKADWMEAAKNASMN